MYSCDNGQKAHALIDHIFQDLLPAQGMTERSAQIKLSHVMLEAMLGNTIALCDAGTGIGKTLAYLIAGMVFLLYQSEKESRFQPVVISTFNIALYKGRYWKNTCHFYQSC